MRYLAMVWVGLLLIGCEQSGRAQALPVLDPQEQFGEFTRAERWYLHHALPAVNDGIQAKYEVLVPLLDANDLPAIQLFARAYSGGRGPLGGPQDFARSFELHSKGAALGDPGSMVSLGYMHLQGTSVEKDAQKALNWFERAFDLSGSGAAASGISLVYSQGYGRNNVEKDEREAERWRERAREAKKAEQKARLEAGGSAARKKQRKAELTRGVVDGEGLLLRYHELRFAEVEERAKRQDPDARAKLGYIKLGKDAYWRATSYRGKVFDPAGGMALLEKAYELERETRKKRRLAKTIASYYGSSGPREIRDADKQAQWESEAARY